MDTRYFFAKDDSCHWYMVPEDLREEWDRLSDYGDDDDAIDEFEDKFGEFRTGGGINHYSFLDPKILE